MIALQGSSRLKLFLAYLHTVILFSQEDSNWVESVALSTARQLNGTISLILYGVRVYRAKTEKFL